MSLITFKDKFIYFEMDYPVEEYLDLFDKSWYDNNIFITDKDIIVTGPVSKVLLNSISSRLLKKGKTKINKKYYNFLYVVKKYFKEKWKKPNSKKEYIKKYIEFQIFNETTKEMSEAKSKNINYISELGISPRISNYIKNISIEKIEINSLIKYIEIFGYKYTYKYLIKEIERISEETLEKLSL